ncbi:unnamed protein product, partial [Meganyctiphanes norvegica]
LGDKNEYEITLFISTFEALNNFAVENNIKYLIKCFDATGVSETLKIHVILYHIADALSVLNKGDLGLWSEQTGESIHRELKNEWDEYKNNLLEDVNYGSRLKNAVDDY